MSGAQSERLAELIDRKHRCLEELREMGRRQLELIRGGEMTALLDVLVSKQRLIERLHAVERDLNPFRLQPPQSRRWRSQLEKQKCSKQIETCKALLREILEQEKLGESELARRRDAAAVRRDGVHRAGQARGAYVAAERRHVAQLDIASEV